MQIALFCTTMAIMTLYLMMFPSLLNAPQDDRFATVPFEIGCSLNSFTVTHTDKSFNLEIDIKCENICDVGNSY